MSTRLRRGISLHSQLKIRTAVLWEDGGPHMSSSGVLLLSCPLAWAACRPPSFPSLSGMAGALDDDASPRSVPLLSLFIVSFLWACLLDPLPPVTSFGAAVVGISQARHIHDFCSHKTVQVEVGEMVRLYDHSGLIITGSDRSVRTVQASYSEVELGRQNRITTTSRGR